MSCILWSAGLDSWTLLTSVVGGRCRPKLVRQRCQWLLDGSRFLGEREVPRGGWLILRHPSRDSCPEPCFFDLTNQVFLLRSKAPSHPFLPVCLSACLSICRRDPSVYASISICLQSCRLTSLGSSVPMCDLRVQRRLFLPQHFQHSFFLSQHFCVFAPVFLGHSLAVWVALALPNMPPKARAPEARMVFGWGQVSGVEICTCSGPSRCLPTVVPLSRWFWMIEYIFPLE